jgi:hypothetical protein
VHDGVDGGRHGRHHERHGPLFAHAQNSVHLLTSALRAEFAWSVHIPGTQRNAQTTFTRRPSHRRANSGGRALTSDRS